jgi:hypothetical protein
LTFTEGLLTKYNLGVWMLIPSKPNNALAEVALGSLTKSANIKHQQQILIWLDGYWLFVEV